MIDLLHSCWITGAGCCFALLALCPIINAQKRARDLGISPGILNPGELNAITDVPGVRVGQVTLIEGDSVRTGVTAIIPHPGNIFQQKIPAAIFVGNGFGKLAGSTQVEELGNIETPIVLTNTLNVSEAIAALIEYTLTQHGNEQARSVNAVVGETNDGYLNDIRGRHVTKAHVLDAIRAAKGGAVSEGAVGAGTGTICFGFKGGIGTSSRILPPSLGGYAIGILVQTNYGGILEINGAPVGQELGKYYLKDNLKYSPDGSCMIIVATDAPLDARNLKRLAARALLGLAKTGSSSSNGSGDYAVAFSTAADCRIPASPSSRTLVSHLLHNDAISPLFQAAKEATEEAVYNSLFMARTIAGYNGHTVEELPVEKALEICRKYRAVKEMK
jgi:D-aminopeptidase